MTRPPLVIPLLYLCVKAQLLTRLPVTITSDAGSVVCVNTTIILTCHATGATNFKWTTGDHSEVANNNSDTITVTATPETIEYTCTASDDNGNTGRSSITVASNGSIPVVNEFNFNEYEIVFVGGSINLTVEYSPNVLTFKWYRFHATLPPGDRSSIINYSVKGKNYSSLILSNMTDDDWGLYFFTVTSYCGLTTSVNVTVDVRSDHTCFHGPVPILNITAHQTTIRGEVITFTCWFGGNYSPDTEVAYEIYWKVFQDGNLFFIDDGMNHTGYQLMPPSPYCNNSDSSFLCCQFISELKINSSVVSHDVSVGCNALTNNQPSKSLTSSLTVVETPLLTDGPHTTRVKEHGTVSLKCAFTTSEIPHLSICAWSNEDGRIFSSDKYHINQTSVPGRGNLVDCTLTVSSVTKVDVGKYYCYCYYNESFWDKYHVPKFSNISSQRGEAMLQLVDDTSGEIKLENILKIAGYFIASILTVVGLAAVSLISIVSLSQKLCLSIRGRNTVYVSVPVCEDDDENHSLRLCEGHQVKSTTTTDGGNSGVSGEQLHLTNVIPVSSTSALLVDILEVSENVDDIHTEGRADEDTSEHVSTTRQTPVTIAIQEEASSQPDGATCIVFPESVPSQSAVPVLQDEDSEVPTEDPLESIGTDGIAQFVKIIEEPQDQIIKLKNKDFTIKLCCNAESPSRYDLSYKWYSLKYHEKPGSFNEKMKTVKCSKPCLELTMSASSYIHERRYCCKVSAAGHSIWSRIVVIKFEHVWIVEQPKERTVVLTGKVLKLSCKAESAPGVTVRYKWFTCDKDGVNKLPVKCNSMKLVISETNLSHKGFYVCEISGQVDSRVIYVEVVNPADIKITMQPSRDKYIELGEELSLECKAKCKHHPVSYQWYFNETPLRNHTGYQLVIPFITQSDIGSYYCTASSEYSAGVVKSETSRLVLRSSLPAYHRNLIEAEQPLMYRGKSYAVDKVALLIGIRNYEKYPLTCPHNDVKAMTEKLQDLNFKTISLVDVTLTEMSRAVDFYCNLLKKGMYAVFYFSGHGIADCSKTSYLVPIDATNYRSTDSINYDEIRQKLQNKLSKVIVMLDCCRTVCPEPLSTVNPTEQDGYANIVEIYACAPSFEAFEMNNHSLLTEAILYALDNSDGKKLIHDICPTISKYHTEHNIPADVGKRLARVSIRNQMTYDISLDDPIYIPPGEEEKELTEKKELLLELPESVTLHFNHPDMKTTYGHIQLDFEEEFSNVLIVHITCDVKLQPELNVQELENLGLAVIKNTETSYKIGNLLDLKDAVQSFGTPAQLQFTFRMPHNLIVKDTIVYELPTMLINPAFYN